MKTPESSSPSSEKKSSSLFLWLFIGFNLLMALIVVYKVFFG